jgi:hypothetical protein
MSQNLTNAECTELARVVRQAIEGDRYPLSPRVQRWKELLAKLAPTDKPPVEPFTAAEAGRVSCFGWFTRRTSGDD